MTSRKTTIALCLLSLATLPMPIHATSANFLMACAFGSPSTLVNCFGDPGQPSGSPSSCGSSTFNSYFLTWGDGSSPQAVLTALGDGHSYSSPATFETVCVTVLCNDGTYATACRTLCTLSNPASCPAGDIKVNGTFN